MPHLERCLGSLRDVARELGEFETILVDSASTDDTLACMTAFAENRPGTRVFSIAGQTNAAVARNVVLANAAPGAVFLVDGDVAINPAFVREALNEVAAGQADVVVGQLPECFYDEAARLIGRGEDRYKIHTRRYIGITGGLSLLSPRVVAGGPRFDERLRTGEDPDFSVRLACRFRILALPMPMGVHHTVRYFHSSRRRAYARDVHAKGLLLRRHLLHPRRLWRLRRIFIGIAAGGAIQIALLAAILSGSWVAIVAIAACAGLDAAMAMQRRGLTGYVLIRLVSPWILLRGVMAPEPAAPSYAIRSIDLAPPTKSASTVRPAV